MSMGHPPLVSQVRRGLAWSLVNSLTIRVGNVLVAAIIARLLTPSQFGIFAVALTVQLVLGTLAEFGLGADLIRSERFEDRAPAVATVALVMAAGLAGIMAATAGLVARAFESPEATPVIVLMSVSVMISGFSVVPSAALQREFQQARMFAADGAGLLVSTTVTVVLAASGMGAMSLAWARIAAQLVVTGLQYVLAGRHPRFGVDVTVLRSVARFGAPLALANFLSWLLLTVDNVVVARAGGPVLLGLYVIAFNVSSWPMSAIGQAVRVVALPAFTRARTGDNGRAALAHAVGLTWAGGLLAGVLLGTLATPLIRFLFGESWVPAAAALVGLGAFGGLRVLFDLLATYLVAIGASRPVLVVQAIWIVVLIPAMVWSIHVAGLAGAGWAHLFVAGLAVLPCYLMALRFCGVSAVMILRSLVPPLAAAVPMAIVAQLTARFVLDPLLALLIGGAGGASIFLALEWGQLRRHLRALSATAETVLVTSHHRSDT